jgi:hypothetical protein
VASKKGNGHDGTTMEMVEILKRIDGRIEGLRREMQDELTGLRADIGGLRREMQQGFADVNQRLDALHEDMIEVHAGQTSTLTELRGLRGEAKAELDELRQRVLRLEAAVFKPAAE